jgi:plasmid stabilization system protein ParE
VDDRGSRWVVRLTAAVEADYQNIIAWTLEQFGDLQARASADTLSAALVELAAGPTTVGAKERSEIGKGLFALHVAARVLQLTGAPERCSRPAAYDFPCVRK